MEEKKFMINMSQEEKLDLASKMYNPIRCGGAGYENGRYYLSLGW